LAAKRAAARKAAAARRRARIAAAKKRAAAARALAKKRAAAARAARKAAAAARRAARAKAAAARRARIIAAAKRRAAARAAAAKKRAAAIALARKRAAAARAAAKKRAAAARAARKAAAAARAKARRAAAAAARARRRAAAAAAAKRRAKCNALYRKAKVVWFRAHHSNKVLDIPGNRVHVNQKIIQWPRHLHANQRFILIFRRDRRTFRIATYNNPNMVYGQVGSLIKLQKRRKGDRGQIFRFHSHHRIINQNNRCLDIRGASRANHADLLAWSCHRGANQRFSVNTLRGRGDQDRAYAAIKADTALRAAYAAAARKRAIAAAKRRAAAAAAARKRAAAAAARRKAAAAAAAKKRKEISGKARVAYFTAHHSRQVLDIPGGRAHVNQKIIQWRKHLKSNQRFILLFRKDGSFRISAYNNANLVYGQVGNTIRLQRLRRGAKGQIFKFGPSSTIVNGNNRCLDIRGGSRRAGADLLAWGCHRGANQRFTVSYVASGGDFTHAFRAYKFVCGLRVRWTAAAARKRAAAAAAAKRRAIAARARAAAARKRAAAAAAARKRAAARLAAKRAAAASRVRAIAGKAKVVYFQAYHSGQVLDIPGGRIHNNQKIIQWRRHLGANQRFILIYGRNGTFRIGAYNNSKMVFGQVGHSIKLQRFNRRNRGQVFRFYSHNRIINGNNRCLDIRGSSRRQGADLLAWGCHNHNNQKFRFHTLSSSKDITHAFNAWRSYFVLRRKVVIRKKKVVVHKKKVVSRLPAPRVVYFQAHHSRKVLDIPGNRVHVNQKIIQWPRHLHANQRFVLVYRKDRSFRIAAYNNASYVFGQVGTSIKLQRRRKGDRGQIFRFYSHSRIINGNNRCLDIRGGSRRNHADLLAWGCHRHANQRFSVHTLRSGADNIRARNAAKYDLAFRRKH